MNAFEIVIENPFSPALIILAVVAATIIIVGIITEVLLQRFSRSWRRNDDSGWAAGIGVGVAIVSFMIGFFLITDFDRDARVERVETALGETYLNVQVDEEGYSFAGYNFTAEDKDGSYIEGRFYPDSSNDYTVVILP